MKRKLTDTFLKRSAKPNTDGTPCNYTDGGGLYLHVKGNDKKWWRYNYRFDGKQKTLSIGSYPEVGLDVARRHHDEARELLARGVDPSEHKRTTKAIKGDMVGNSFEAIAREYYQKYRNTWQQSYSDKMMGYFEKDVFPWIGSKPIGEIEAPEIVRLICRQDERGAGGAARKVKQHIQQVYDYAVAVGLATRNPARDIKTSLVLKPRQVKHFASIKEPGKVGELMRAIYGYQGQFATCCALKLSALTMLRPSELIKSKWDEIDLDQGMFTIPVKRMKARTHIKEANLTAHYVPLCSQAIAILTELKPLTGRGKGGYVFPSIRTTEQPMSNNTVNAALRRMGFTKEEMTGHGFRSMASSLLNEMRNSQGMRRWDKDVIERQLAHTEANKVRAAYNHAEYLDERREMLQAWADYLDGLRAGGQVVPFRKAK